jgi:hypothetical protein
MSTFGREADAYARKIREINKRALEVANERPTVSLTSRGNLRVRQGDKTISFSRAEARGIARDILVTAGEAK